MNKTNIDQALAALADALKSQEPDSFLTSPKEFVKKIPFRSLSGDHINGGKVQQIPNYKTVEVLLRERNRTSEDIRVIEISEFEDLIRVTYQNIYIEEGMSPDDAANRAAETIVQLAEQAKTEG
jgi:hypothetical protein